ncbi:GAF domain-containing protein [Mucilaginibacter aquatilis]|uniref:GAF domain-containing protein n=1 Tax=Mucilaginibacter aquatilis TaxID=1517760 RepID=A0A6I4IH26_9SPHI|nr:GAF domain-containing protein [Mucilaginibacter aquatilis]MVN92659.1 GAF domain-containing protein [Mucilaginibacter aquatilis]
MASNYDSEFCGNLPLHNVNMIQPHGYLVVLEKESLNIIQISENLSDVLETSAAEIVSSSFSDYVPQKQIDELKAKIETGIKDKIPVSLTLNNVELLALVHARQEYFLLELEKVQAEDERTFINVFQEIKYVMAAVDVATSVQDACEIAIRELKRISGFDGIMMYRFDENWNGTVIAEDKTDALEPYLGVTFPASDVPRQARELYLRNPYRLIPNREYTPVRLYPVLNSLTNSFTDLSDCNLRSVAAVHIEYLGNMGVTASMSVRVIHNEQLWGLIACHHTKPYYLSFELCSIFELLSSVVSNKISSIINKEEYGRVADLQSQRNSIIDHIYSDRNIEQGLLEHDENILKLFNSKGAVIFNNSKITTAGEVPQNDMLENLHLWLHAKEIGKVFSTTTLPDIFDEAASEASIASGALIIPLDSHNGNYIVCFRPEVVQTITWGGDPNQTINFAADGKTYHPRNSFKSWLQTVKNTSLPWHKDELGVADTLRSFVYEFKTKQAI